ncbi:MAG: beta-galactosidase [Clostridiales bacterium]|jgi:hypothetical protein|nr:beta-galactosidase [Clostridiales bacterium]
MDVRFREGGIVVGGRAAVVLSGEFQYFRTDPGEWRDRLEKLRAMGLNAIGAYFPWNYHSDGPGHADFGSPHRDVGRFLRLAGELGLWVVARPGPYVCNEWDLGGYPAWLMAEPSGDWRTGQREHLRLCRQWLRAVHARLAPHQIGRGGPILLYQVENEHFWGDRALFESLAAYAAEDGIRVPLVGNHEGSVYKVGAEDIADGIDIYTPVWELYRWRGWLERMRDALPPDVPLMVLEYMGASFCTWGEPAADEDRLPSPWVRMQAMLFLAKGANLANFFVAAGGVNPPGFGSDHSCTCYMADAAVSHWGGLGRKFYEMRLLAEAVGSFQEALGLSKPADIGRGADNANVECLARTGPRGDFYFLFNNTVRPQSCRIRLPDGRAPIPGELRIGAKSAALLVADLRLSARTALGYCTMPIFRLWRVGGVVHAIAYGAQGARCCAGVRSGERLLRMECGCSADVGVAVLDCDDCAVVLYAVTQEVAERTWFARPEIAGGALADGAWLDGVLQDRALPLFGNLPLARPCAGAGAGASWRALAEADAGAAVEIIAPCGSLSAGGIAVAGEKRADGLARFRFAAPEPGSAEFSMGAPEYRAEGCAWRLADAEAGDGWQPVGPFDGRAGCLLEPGSYEYRADFSIGGGDMPEAVAFTGITGVEAQFWLNGHRLGVFPDRRPGAYHQLPGMSVEFSVAGIARRGLNRLAATCELLGRHNLGRPIYAGINRPVLLMGAPREMPIPLWKERFEAGRPLEMPELQAVPAEALPGFDDSGWGSVDVAAPRNLPPDEFSDWHCVRWYRARVEVPEDFRGRPLFLRLPRASEAWVYADGALAGYANEHLSTTVDLRACLGRKEISLCVALRYVNWLRPWALLGAPVLFAADGVLEGWRLRRGSEGQRKGWHAPGQGWRAQGAKRAGQGLAAPGRGWVAPWQERPGGQEQPEREERPGGQEQPKIVGGGLADPLAADALPANMLAADVLLADAQPADRLTADAAPERQGRPAAGMEHASPEFGGSQAAPVYAPKAALAAVPAYSPAAAPAYTPAYTPADTPADAYARLWYRREIAVRRPEKMRAPIYVELDDGWKSYARIYWNGSPIGLYADIGPDRRFYVPDRLIAETNALAIAVDGYHSPTACGGVAMGVYERRVPIDLRFGANWRQCGRWGQ